MTMHPGGTEHSLDRAANALSSLARRLGVPADGAALRRNLIRQGGRADPEALARAARQMGFPVSWCRFDRDSERNLTLPALVEIEDGEWWLVESLGRMHVALRHPDDELVRRLSRRRFRRMWTGVAAIGAAPSPDAGDGTVGDAGSPLRAAFVRHRGVLTELLLGSFFLQTLSLAAPIAFLLVIDKVINHNGINTLDVILVALVSIALFEALTGGLRAYVLGRTTARIDTEVTARLFRHLTELPFAYFTTTPLGEIMSRFSDADKLRSYVMQAVVGSLVDLLFSSLFVAVLFFLSREMAWIALAALVLQLLAALAATPLQRSALRERDGRSHSNQSLLAETVLGIETVKALAVEPARQRQWDMQLSAYGTAHDKASRISNTMEQLTGLLGKLSTAVLLWYGTHLVLAQTLTLGQLIAFNLIAMRIAAPILRLARNWLDLQGARLAYGNLKALFAVEAETRRRRPPMPAITGDIEFVNVSFSYGAGGPQVLAGLSVRIGAGEVVALVGPSGTGKSTVGRLLAGLHAPNHGKVVIDGIDISAVDPGTLRSQIGLVSQDCFLFARSVRENIAISQPTMEIQEVMDAAKLAGAQGFISNLPHGYDTVVGERGATLSAGQRQRVALARALASRPAILILDEATSAVDEAVEREIVGNFETIARGRTVVVIGHRGRLVAQARRVLTLENGCICEVPAVRHGAPVPFHRRREDAP